MYWLIEEEECITVEEVEGFKQNNLSSEIVFANANKKCNSLSSGFFANQFPNSFCNLMRMLTIVIVGGGSNYTWANSLIICN